MNTAHLYHIVHYTYIYTVPVVLPVGVGDMIMVVFNVVGIGIIVCVGITIGPVNEFMVSTLT